MFANIAPPSLRRFGDWWGTGKNFDLPSPPLSPWRGLESLQLKSMPKSWTTPPTYGKRTWTLGIDHCTNPYKLWKVVRSLHKRNSGIPAGHEAILSPNSTLIPSQREQTDLLVKHYASISRLPHCQILSLLFISTAITRLKDQSLISVITGPSSKWTFKRSFNICWYMSSFDEVAAGLAFHSQ